MQQNDKSYTFLLQHSFKNRIYIRRVKVSKRSLQSGLLSLALFIGLTAFGGGIFGIYNGTANGTFFAGMNGTTLNNTSSLSINTPKKAPSSIPGTIDYSRPNDSKNFAFNSGGPYVEGRSDSEDAELERQLAVIRSTSDPEYLPSIWAHLGKINNEYGFRRNPFGGRTYEFHAGMDIDGERGDMVVAPASGIVTKAGWQGGYGNMIEVDHGNGLTTRYGHLSKLAVTVGDTLSRGVLIAYVGSTGRSTGPHLHYELRLNDRPINPRQFLPPEPADISK